MSNLVIVAIPDENDKVWKISSEKVPHLSLLFLGDSDQVANLEQIVLFVEHASSLMGRFHLSVDRRGELGADQADVIFFKKNRYEYKAIRDFRATLLQDNNIKTAHDSATQFEGPWNPHLTLGYPATPAKPDPDDYGFYSVEFTKISVWVDDYDGPEFLLKDWWDEYETLDTIPMDVAMSDIQHHGVKGQRWGVRREDIERAAESSQSQIGKTVREAGKFARDIEFEAATQRPKDKQGIESSSEAEVKIAEKAGADWRKHDLGPLKSRHPNAGFAKRLLKPLSKDAKAYRADARATFVKRLETTANSMKNVSGTREYTIREHGGDLPQSQYYWEVSSREVRHAVGDVSTMFEVVMDEDGYITDLKKQKSMAQTADLGAEFLAHHGVKGQRWGVRKEEVSGGPEGSHIRIGKSGRATTSVRTGLATAAIGFLAFRSPRVRAEAAAADEHNRQRKVAKKAAKADQKWEKKIYTLDSGVKLHNAMADHFNERIGALNDKPEYKNNPAFNLITHPDNDIAKKYYKDVESLQMEGYRQAVKSVHGSSPSGKKQAMLSEDGQNIKIVDVDKVKHAAEDDEVIEFLLRRDDNDLIVEMNKAEISPLAQSASDLGVEFILEHFGIKGMHWGQRKEPPQAVAPTATSRVPHGTRRKTKIKAEGGENHPAHEDAIKVAQARVKLKKSGTAALSNQELRDVANRLQLENQVGVLTSSKGKLFVSKQFETETQNLARQGVQKGVRTGVSGAPSAARRIRRGAAVAATTAALV